MEKEIMNERYWIEHEESEKIKREEEAYKLFARSFMLNAIVGIFCIWVWGNVFELLKSKS